MKLVAIILVACSVGFAGVSFEVESLKREIFLLAESYQGQGDPDGSKQKSLDVLVEELLKLNPQPPVEKRLNLLYGPWQQIWGPYEYASDKRGVDRSLDPKNIFQVVFKGYYYNVNPNLDRRGRPIKTVLLRGEYALDSPSKNMLTARFTNLRSLKGLPADGLKLHDLPALSEAKKLKNEKTTLPSFIVRRLFGGGALNEVYTDHDMRILYGSSKDNLLKNYIYIMKRVQ